MKYRVSVYPEAEKVLDRLDRPAERDTMAVNVVTVDTRGQVYKHS